MQNNIVIELSYRGIQSRAIENAAAYLERKEYEKEQRSLFYFGLCLVMVFMYIIILA